MTKLIKIAVDAMGGDNSPKKVIDGIVHNHKKNKENFFKIFGNENEISEQIGNKIDKSFYEIVHTQDVVKSADSPLEAAKRGKKTSMWLSIESVKKLTSRQTRSHRRYCRIIKVSRIRRGWNNY